MGLGDDCWRRICWLVFAGLRMARWSLSQAMLTVVLLRMSSAMAALRGSLPGRAFRSMGRRRAMWRACCRRRWAWRWLWARLSLAAL